MCNTFHPFVTQELETYSDLDALKDQSEQKKRVS